MNEDLLGLTSEAPVDQTLVQATAGVMLCKAREAKGLHLSAMAASLKVSVKKLEAIESNQFDLLPDIVFTRALASSICRHLKIDPLPILEKLPPITSPGLKTDESGINTPFRASGEASAMARLLNLPKPVWVAIGLLLFVFFGFASFTWLSKPGPMPTQKANASSLGITATKPTQAASDVPFVPASASVAASDLLPAFPVNDVVSVTPRPSAGVATQAVLFKARGVSWVEVVDAQGVVQLRKTLKSGDVVGASGVRPLSVFVGRVDSVEAIVLGNPFDLKPIAKDNAARFEVK